jgi:hypothetical protein
LTTFDHVFFVPGARAHSAGNLGGADFPERLAAMPLRLFTGAA